MRQHSVAHGMKNVARKLAIIIDVQFLFVQMYDSYLNVNLCGISANSKLIIKHLSDYIIFITYSPI